MTPTFSGRQFSTLPVFLFYLMILTNTFQFKNQGKKTNKILNFSRFQYIGKLPTFRNWKTFSHFSSPCGNHQQIIPTLPCTTPNHQLTSLVDCLAVMAVRFEMLPRAVRAGLAAVRGLIPARANISFSLIVPPKRFDDAWKREKRTWLEIYICSHNK